MVSLAEGRRGGNGAYTFVTPPSEPADEDHTDSGPVILDSGEHVPLVTGADNNFTMSSLESSNILVPFRRTRLHWTVIANGTAYLIYLVLMFVLPFTLHNEFNYLTHNCQGNSPTPDGYLAYFSLGHVALTGAVCVLCVLQLVGLRRMETRGYTRFCKSQRWLLLTPVVVAVIVDTSLQVLLSLLYALQVNLCSWGTEGSSFKPGYLLFICVTMETLISCVILTVFIGRCVRFNIVQPSPDVLQDMVEGTRSITQAPPTIGFREGSDVDTLLERQADTIRYLQQHNATLAKRVLLLQQDGTHR